MRILAGIPVAIHSFSTDFVTTDPAPTIAIFPIETLGNMMVPAPNQQSSFKWIFPIIGGLISLIRELFASEERTSVTFGPIATLSSMINSQPSF